MTGMRLQMPENQLALSVVSSFLTGAVVHF